MPNGQIDAAGLTDVGRVRTKNEDQFVVAHLNKSLLIQETSLSIKDQTRLDGGSEGHLFLVADGEGGGEDNSTAVVVFFRETAEVAMEEFELEADPDLAVDALELDSAPRPNLVIDVEDLTV